MRAFRLALVPLGISFGIAAEWAAYEDGEFAVASVDLAVGVVLVVCGGIAWDRKRSSRIGALMSLSGLTWFLGTLWSPALYLHRGPLVHMHLSYPTGRLPTRLAGAVVTTGYLVALIEPLAANDVLTLALSGMVALTALQVFLGTSGPARKAGGPALLAALAFAGVLGFAAVERLAGWEADRAVLWTYDFVIACIAIVLLVDLLRGRWADAVVTGLVVDLGAPDDVGTLRGKLARALGDPSLVVGYPLAHVGGFVDDAGRPIDLPTPGSGRTVTAIDERGERIAVLVHDEAVLADPRLVESVAAAARIAVANVRLHAEAQARADELEASRRRIVEAADAERRRLEEELRQGAEKRLGNVATLFADARTAAADTEAIRSLEGSLEEARSELRKFAQGVHPASLTDGGLMPALRQLSARSPIHMQVTGKVERLPALIEAALYFVCSESLANAIKHAHATEVRIEVGQTGGRIAVAIEDNGVGGAQPSQGSGLRGLADRVEALGGRLSVASPPGGGTRIVAELPWTASEPV